MKQSLFTVRPIQHALHTPHAGHSRSQHLLLLGIMTLALAACSGPVTNNTTDNPSDNPSDNPTDNISNNSGGRSATAQPIPGEPQPLIEPEPFIDPVPENRQAATTPSTNTSPPTTTGTPVNEQAALVDLVENDGMDQDLNAPQDRPQRRRAEASAPALSREVVSIGISQPASQAYDMAQLTYHGPTTNRENYLTIDENTIKRVADEPVSTFSIDVDTAGYSNVRRMLSREGRLPPHDAVRLEEMINYFDYDYPVPDSLERPLAIHTETMASPWNPGNQLLMVGMKGFEPAADARPHANLVFLVDVSGSMQSPDKLGLVKSSLQLLVSQMRAEDRIALVVYAGAAGLVLDSTPGSDRQTIINALDSLTAGGSTNGAAGIQLAYQVAEANQIEGGINRVIIASDGDLNVGVTSIDDLKEMIETKRENGIALTTLGFGSGNYNYSLMEQLADTGNGNAAYIDSLSEAQKVLVEEMQSTLLTIAKDVKIQIEFNPNVVAEYRLIGYENRLLNREDFRNDRVDAGEVGAGHTVTALYEVSLKGSTGSLVPELRYGNSEVISGDFGNELAFVNVRYKMPDAERSTEFGQPVLRPDASELEPSADIRFAAAVAGFGQLLRGGRHTSGWDYDELLELARLSRGDDRHGYRAEMVKLVELARVL